MWTTDKISCLHSHFKTALTLPNSKLYHMFPKITFCESTSRVKNRHQGNLEVVQVCCRLASSGRSIEASLLWSSISTDVVGEQIYNRPDSSAEIRLDVNLKLIAVTPVPPNCTRRAEGLFNAAGSFNSFQKHMTVEWLLKRLCIFSPLQTLWCGPHWRGSRFKQIRPWMY